MENKHLLGVRAVALVVLAIAIGIVGRTLLDWLVIAAPTYSIFIEQIGGFFVGLIAGAVALIPIFKMYGVFDKH